MSGIQMVDPYSNGIQVPDHLAMQQLSTIQIPTVHMKKIKILNINSEKICQTRVIRMQWIEIIKVGVDF